MTKQDLKDEISALIDTSDTVSDIELVENINEILTDYLNSRMRNKGE